MTIENGKVVTLHYQLFNAEDGSEIENSNETGEPMAYLHGYNNIIAGLEKALEGKGVGEQVDVTVEAKEAYGEYDNTLFQRISRKYLKHAGKLVPGKVVTVSTEEGPRMLTVLKVGLKTVDVDANHPLAGKALRFVVDITDIRDASDEEKAHKHAHGVGGHQH
ncbi:MAG: peptidylprolyl isomerase [Alcanivoracaceae bacterium]|uniref:FKBP-type peptidyl-prolyl cis-trans isomerase n=1 Tax=Alcanivorax sp. MD8A TaxID=1177157 RepID=UPI000C5EF8CB|nr:peptidylprolyl isomerase [Alcanivorax sp. MD8A]MAX56032.1 peptidylprolyl isomerase [Alcanivoracaceae bacterium]MCG8436902.1 peptidylprolyl isomerase [Pseudomonadales bacterium]MED5431938.1 peptidylprolyl isomerase [Pseudomonadota bacterium]MEE2869109.1 peptidylprolyl isomerase [Pseudomonadota bacterium]PNE03896.1 peptidyl-prolyl cis-trans isomerase [Alcanivorax sp. MD8A]|tara:strand:+ start:599 stop:1087 length:489 start_codon:yes stop_codon:yes gene_type:complete